MVGAAIGDLVIDEVLVDYDGPRVFVCRGVDGAPRLGLSVLDDGLRAQYCVVPVTAEQLVGVRSGAISLREPFETARHATQVTVTGAGTRTEVVDGPVGELPAPGIGVPDLVDDRVGSQPAPTAAVSFGGLVELVARARAAIESLGRPSAQVLAFAAADEVHVEERNADLGALGVGPALQVTVGITPGSTQVTLAVSVEPAGDVDHPLQVQVTVSAEPGGDVLRRGPFRETRTGRLSAEVSGVDIGRVTRIEIVAAPSQRW